MLLNFVAEIANHFTLCETLEMPEAFANAVELYVLYAGQPRPAER